MDNVAIVKRVFDAIAARDPASLEALCSEDLVFQGGITGALADSEHYEGQDALVRYLADADRAWLRFEPRPRTFHSFRADRVMVAGTVLAEHGGATREVTAAWLWSLRDGLIVYVRILPTAMAHQTSGRDHRGARV